MICDWKLCVVFDVCVAEMLECQAEQLKSSYAELQLSLASEREHCAELTRVLAAEQQAAASAHEQCSVVAERLSEMEKTLVVTESRLQAVLYVHIHTRTHDYSVMRCTRDHCELCLILDKTIV